MIFDFLQIDKGCGEPVYRQIYVDGEIPFAELKEYKFKYDYNYYTETLSDGNGNPYYIYLKSGEHTLTMETLMGELGDVALTFYNESEKLNLITREIQKIIYEKENEFTIRTKYLIDDSS